MSDALPPPEVKRRAAKFADKIRTKIWKEEPCEDNPFIAQTVRCYGYDLLELSHKASLSDAIYLLHRGRLPDASESELFKRLTILIMNPGPRHEACRAAMNAGVGKTDPAHILPIGLTLLGGERGAGEVERAMRFYRKHVGTDPELIDNQDYDPGCIPGYGQYYGGVDVLAFKYLEDLCCSNATGQIMKWCFRYADWAFEKHCGITREGLVAAVLCDLGFLPRFGAVLYQLLNAPGVLAHGMEFTNKAFCDFPFVDDKDYVIEK